MQRSTAIALSLFVACPAARAADFALTVRAGPEVHVGNGDSPFDAASDVTGTGRPQGKGEVLARARYEGLTAASSLRFTVDRPSGPVGNLLVNELYYDGSLFGEHFTLGKKVLSWDVGFAFRPLDVVQREDRRALNPFALNGVPVVAWEHFAAESAWSLFWVNPFAGQGGQLRDDEAIVGKYYRRLLGFDVHLLGRFSHRDRLGAGLGLAGVIGEALELHGSLLYQQRYDTLVDPLAAQPGPLLAAVNPIGTASHRDAVSALVGGSFTWASGVSLLLEAFRDPTAPTSAEWKALRALGQRQLALLGGAPRDAVVGNLAWGARFFERPNLLRDNVLTRLSYKHEELETAVDVLFAPEDRGWVLNSSVSFETQRSRAEAGVRIFGGPSDAAYRLLPERGMLYASWKMSL